MSEEPPAIIADLRCLVIGVHSGMMAVSSLSILVRIYTRIRVAKWVGVDDIFICTAFLLAILEASSGIVGVNYGLGQHTAVQPPENVEPYTKSTLVAFASYNAAIMFVKLSLLAFYIRLSTQRIFRMAVYTMMGLSAAFGVCSVVTVGLQCLPIWRLWDSSTQGTCINIGVFYYTNGAINVATEILIYVLPLSTWWKLRLPMVQNIGVWAALGVGALTILASIHRVTAIRGVQFWTDQCWYVVDPLIWSTVELHMAILACCIPVFKSLVQHHSHSVTETNHDGHHAIRDEENNHSRLHNLAFLRPSATYQHSSPQRQSKTFSLSSIKQNSGYPRPLSTTPYRHNTTYSISSLSPADISNQCTGTQTTIICSEGFRYKGNSESEEHMIAPLQGILAHTSVHVEHEQAMGIEKSDSISNISSVDGQYGFR